MILFRSSLAASAGGAFIWEQLSILHQSLATITRGLVNILPGSLAEAGSWELSCVMRTQVQSVTMVLQSAQLGMEIETHKASLVR